MLSRTVFSPGSVFGIFFLIPLSRYVIHRLTDCGRTKPSEWQPGKVQLMCALFGAVMGPIICMFAFYYVPGRTTLGRVVAHAAAGAAIALVIGNREALALRLSRKMRQIMVALFGAVVSIVVLMPYAVRPTLDVVAAAAVMGVVLALIEVNTEPW